MMSERGKELRTAKDNRAWKTILVHIILGAGLLIVAFPFFWMLMTSFKLSGEAMKLPPTVFPEKWTLAAYARIIQALPFAQIYLNTVLATIATTVSQIVICSMAAYSFAKIDFPGKNFIFMALLSVLMVPGQIFLIPQYTIIMKAGLLNTLPALFIPNMFSAFGTFLLRQQLAGLDHSLIEAARVEGASEWRIFSRVIIPIMKPSLSALAALTFVECWNIVDQAVVFIRDSFDEPLSVYLSKIITSSPGLVFAASVLFMIPAFLVFLMSQDYLAGGIALSSGGRK